MAWTYGQRRHHTAAPARVLSMAALLLLLPAITLGLAQAATETSGGDKAAVVLGPIGQPNLVDALFPSMAAARRWITGDRAYVGMLAGQDVETKLCDPGVGSQAGYFKIEGSKDTNYFYWFFESRSDPANDPVVVWLTGGPGCSSILALLSENGPCFVDVNGTGTTINPYSWTTRANVIWIDQPAGVGFSYASQDDPVVDTEEEVGEDLYQFLQSFFAANPRFASNPFYIFGESYGGHYVPAVGHKIFEANKELAASAAAAGEGQKQQQQEPQPVEQQRVRINLKGLGIGNGLVYPEIQYQYYADYGMNNTYNVQLFTEDIAHKINRAVPRCVSLIHSCQTGGKAACVLSRVFCTSRILDYFPLKERNIYDIRTECAHPPLCYDFDNVVAYLARPDVREALHVHEAAGPWKICSDAVMVQFLPDVMRNYHELLVPLLENGVKVLAYGGDSDYICNVFGIEAWTESLPGWKEAEGYRATPGRVWRTTGGTAAGVIRSYGGLTFLRVLESGHMVPLDQPQAALEMLNAFTGSDPQAVQSWEAAIREGKVESTRAPTAVIQGAADAAASSSSSASSTPPAAAAANDNNNSKNKDKARALRGKGTGEQQAQREAGSAGSGVVEQEIEAVPRLD